MITLKEAAEAVGMTKPAVLKAIQKGVLSANKDAYGRWEIEPSELHRVYKPVTKNQKLEETENKQEAPQIADSLRLEIGRIQEERERERRQLQEVITDLREDRDKWREQATTLLLTDQRPKSEEEKKLDTNQPINKTTLAFYISSVILLIGLIIWLFLKQQA